MLVYTPHITNRIRYIFDLLLQDDLGLPGNITTDLDFFLQYDQPKLAYNYQPINNVPTIGINGLLQEKGIKNKNITVSKHNNLPVFFETEKEFALPFDVFAASFYLISRYEEYLPFEPDKHGRFQAEQSFAYKNKFLQKPLVDYYVLMLKDILQQHYPQIKIRERKYKFRPTYDIDSAYAHKNKGLVRNTGSILASIAKGNWQSVSNILQVVFGGKKDPFDTYDIINEIHIAYQLKPTFFFLVGDYDEYDKNISIHISEFKTLIKSIADNAEVGIHPSYASNKNPALLNKEIQRLSQVLNRDIKKSRQHFLMLRFPNTFNHLLENDITEDYTLCYSSQPGFRASYSKAFFFYDVEREIKTTLKLHSCAFMDATFQYYLEVSPKQSLQYILPIIEELKKVNGTCISLSHNSAFCNQKGWNNWADTYETIIKAAKE